MAGDVDDRAVRAVCSTHRLSQYTKRPSQARGTVAPLNRGAAGNQRGGRRDRDGTWTNWAGNVRATPRIVVRPGSLADLREVVLEAARRGETVRVAGAGHSFAPFCATDGTLLDLSLLAGLERVDPETGEADDLGGHPHLRSRRAVAGAGPRPGQPGGYRPAGDRRGGLHRDARHRPQARQLFLRRARPGADGRRWRAGHHRRHRAGTAARGLAQPRPARRADPGHAGDRARLPAARAHAGPVVR